MDLALGAMGSLLPKLGQLLSEEYKMQTSVKRDVEAFSRELGGMRAALRRVAEVPREQLDEEVKLWAGDVRELSYDTEDIVDSLLVRVKGSESDADMDGLKELVGKMKNLFKKGKARRQIATAIKDIKEQVQDVAARHERYKADGVFANLAATTRITAVDPLLMALYEDKQRLVGIENARDELIEKLNLTDDVSKQPKILSIVGFGGLGKTTLAKAIYDKIESDFDCAAFVSVSRNPNLRKVFKDLLFEVDKQKYLSLSGATLDERQLIAELQESLGGKRYFIVVDDIWDATAWKTIRYALMGSKHGSRIITTTRNVSVSRECCSYNDDMVYNMQPLSDSDSQRLFYNRIFPGDNICPPELQEVSTDILKKCAGVPLAIITLGSHLASNQQIRPICEWYVLLNSIGTGITKGDTNLEGWYETMPAGINSSSLPLLSYLNIDVRQVRLQDIQVLGALPALRTLRLQSYVDTSTKEERAMEMSFMLSADAFPRATVCSFQNVLFAPHMFSRGAMPVVQELQFGLLVSDILSGGEWDLCIRNLPSLKTVEIKLYGEEAGVRYSEAEAAVERAAAAHPNRPKAHTIWSLWSIC